MADIISQMEAEIPLLRDMRSGHTPIQIEFFKTAQQKGSRKFEFYQHLVQMKALAHTVRTLWLDIEEAEICVAETRSLWNMLFCSPARRHLKRKRLELKLSDLRQSLADAELELSRHLKVVITTFGDLLKSSESDILDAEAEYWVHRLARQLAYARIAAEKGVPAGEVAAIAALPNYLVKEVLAEAQNIVNRGLLGPEDQKQIEG